MALVIVINCYVLDVFPLMICVPLHIKYYIPLLDEFTWGSSLFLQEIW